MLLRAWFWLKVSAWHALVIGVEQQTKLYAKHFAFMLMLLVWHDFQVLSLKPLTLSACIRLQNILSVNEQHAKAPNLPMTSCVSFMAASMHADALAESLPSAYLPETAQLLEGITSDGGLQVCDGVNGILLSDVQSVQT